MRNHNGLSNNKGYVEFISLLFLRWIYYFI